MKRVFSLANPQRPFEHEVISQAAFFHIACTRHFFVCSSEAQGSLGSALFFFFTQREKVGSAVLSAVDAAMLEGTTCVAIDGQCK